MRDFKTLQGILKNSKELDSEGFWGICNNFVKFLRNFKSKTYTAFSNLFDFVQLCLNLFDFVWLTQLCTNFVLVRVVFIFGVVSFFTSSSFLVKPENITPYHVWIYLNFCFNKLVSLFLFFTIPFMNRNFFRHKIGLNLKFISPTLC